jgi:hypothetical protein
VPARKREQAEDERRCPVIELVVVVLILFFVFGGWRFSRR